MADLRQTTPREEVIGERNYFITPFPAFVAANITGELASVLTPLIAALVPLAGVDSENVDSDTDKDSNFFDIDIEKYVPNIKSAFEGVSGDKLEKLLKTLLVEHKNIVVEIENENTGKNEAVRLTNDIANEIFCGELQDMFILAFYVIRLNFSGFFKKAGSLSGKARRATAKERTLL